MIDPAILGHHRALGDALVEADIVVALAREARGLAPDAPLTMKQRLVVVDTETGGFSPYDGLYEVGAVTIERDGSISDDTFHSYVRPTAVKGSPMPSAYPPTGDEWVFRNTTLTPEHLIGAPTGQQVGILLRSYNGVRMPAAWTSYNRAFDFPFLDAWCSFQPELAPCPMLAALDILRRRIPESAGEWPWEGHYHREKTSAAKLAVILRDRGHNIREWAA